MPTTTALESPRVVDLGHRYSKITLTSILPVPIIDDHFKHLPPYTPPKTGLVSHLPSTWIPFAELMRLHKPAGYYASYFPLLIGTFFAAAVSAEVPSLSALARVCAVHTIGNLFLRGAACSWNDTMDAPFDRKVARCRNRPVARGAVPPGVAHVFTTLLTTTWFSILSWLPQESFPPAVLFALLLMIYPFCKRITNFPQVVLGLALGLGQSVGMASLGLDPLAQSSMHVQGAIACLYFSNVVNAMIYDTVYAHQDLKDDLKAGVMSMAVACGGRTREVLTLLSAVEVGLLAVVGYLIGFGPLYFVAAVGGIAAILGTMIVMVDLETPAACMNWFKWTIWLTGAALCTALAGEYVARL
ncbi:Para-hydroxybenzoate--polyprenyltransferase, mitochondrial precursor (PHB:polyprenyltransferase) [Xylographa pallens]|nr:Para-hydroxybenzoate--polyprenyltransferase, mitochondrial precursor (PHB:polyprenyltransferase) [Xylographa pallens]